MNFTYYQYCLLLLGSFILTTVPVSANSLSDLNDNNLVRSPGVAVLKDTASHIGLSPFYLAQNKSNNQRQAREYTFKAPDSKVISNSEQLTQVRGYKVEVYGNEDSLLQQVKDIEPAAFIKGDIIQVGIFGRQDNAEDLVRKLAVRGLWARIIPQ